MTRPARFGLAFLCAVMVLVLLLMQRSPGVPDYFDESLSYEEALARSAQSGKPVFVLAGADWCQPCRTFEGGALRDNRVQEWIASRTIPVFLDVSNESSPGVKAASELGVMSIPAIYLVKGGQPVGAHVGVLDAEQLLNWLETFSTEETAPASIPGD